MKLYHGTSESRLKRIMVDGLKPRHMTGKTNWKHTIESNPNAVYLTSTYPAYFAFTATNKGKEKDRWVIIEVDTNLLDNDKLHPDEDVLEQSGRKYDGLPKNWGMKKRTRWYRAQAEDNPNWEKSLEFMGTCGYYGTIPVEAITRVVLFDPEKRDGAFILSFIDASICLMNYRFCSTKYQAMTRWLMGETVTVEEFSGLTTQWPDWEESKKAWQKELDNRDGLEVFYDKESIHGAEFKGREGVGGPKLQAETCGQIQSTG